MVSAIVAYDSMFGIGRNGTLPWHIPDDLKWFRETTWGNTVIMGRRTRESIGKRLIGRTNIVLTSGDVIDYSRLRGISNSFEVDIEMNSLYDAIILSRTFLPNQRIFIIGGETVYREGIEKGFIDAAYVTRIPGDYRCDRHFPDLGQLGWRRTEVDMHRADGVRRLVFTKQP